MSVHRLDTNIVRVSARCVIDNELRRNFEYFKDLRAHVYNSLHLSLADEIKKAGLAAIKEYEAPYGIVIEVEQFVYPFRCETIKVLNTELDKLRQELFDARLEIENLRFALAEKE